MLKKKGDYTSSMEGVGINKPIGPLTQEKKERKEPPRNRRITFSKGGTFSTEATFWSITIVEIKTTHGIGKQEQHQLKGI